jgi:hypothetical protein
LGNDQIRFFFFLAASMREFCVVLFAFGFEWGRDGNEIGRAR